VRGRIPVAVGAWIAGAAVATGFSHLAVSNLAKGIGADPGQLLSNGAVAHALENAPRITPPTAQSGGLPVVATPAGGASSAILLASPGGTVVARCTGNVAYLKSWSPLQGFLVDAVARGPAPGTRVTFESAHRTVTMRISCVSGVSKVSLQDQPVGSSWGEHGDE
jgi:hypothetical protein